MTEAVKYQTDTSDMLIPHGLFRSVFATADSVIEGVRSDDLEQAEAVHSYFDNLLRFLDAHHDGEDAIVWPVLSERCPSAHDLIARMEAEHEAIHDSRDRAGSLLTAWAEHWDAPSGRAFAQALTDLGVKVEEHFIQEEADVLPLASTNMSPEEWGGLPGHAMGHFTGDKIWLILGLVLEQMTAEQRAFTLTLLPPPAVEMWTTMGNAAFDDFIGRVRRAA